MTSRGFTLIELLAVVLIMGILTAVAVPQYRSSMERSRIAEAVQMLPAIFDARERLLEDPQTTDKKNVIFSRLDMEMKGHQMAASQVPVGIPEGWYWATDSFKYKLFDDDQDGKYKISAQLTRGKFKGAMLYFNGSNITCCKKDSVEKDTCDILNVPVLKEGC